ncbi:hypothetical protein QTP88_005474 [Uroleucon formosanum]
MVQKTVLYFRSSILFINIKCSLIKQTQSRGVFLQHQHLAPLLYHRHRLMKYYIKYRKIQF